jgi:hypothetical protein
MTTMIETTRPLLGALCSGRLPVGSVALVAPSGAPPCGLVANAMPTKPPPTSINKDQ